MPAPATNDPVHARAFAADVVARLRQAGYESYWAGGCVRDDLLGRTPVDYDVATAARPDDVRRLFGRGRTIAVGAAFGVITVLGPESAGQVEVATFRSDAAYTDGRHPAGITFCSAREDASRRDFTINGLFLDPVSGSVIDFVAGREDLAAGVIRAIGVPAQRFGEDHLRMLRGIRFAAAFGFVLEDQTRAAIERLGHLVASVSPERIAAELRAMVERPGRLRALELLAETGLAAVVLPEFFGPGVAAAAGWPAAAAIVDALDEPDLPLALATLAEGQQVLLVERSGARLRLANREVAKATWLHAAILAIGRPTTADLAGRPWSTIQPLVAHPLAASLADLLRARAVRGVGATADAAWFTAQVARPRIEIDPPPLLTGADLLAAGIPAGRGLGRALETVRALQLDGRIGTRDEALDAARSAAG